jgi:hypothetical protein
MVVREALTVAETPTVQEQAAVAQDLLVKMPGKDLAAQVAAD